MCQMRRWGGAVEHSGDGERGGEGGGSRATTPVVVTSSSPSPWLASQISVLMWSLACVCVCWCWLIRRMPELLIKRLATPKAATPMKRSSGLLEGAENGSNAVSSAPRLTSPGDPCFSGRTVIPYENHRVVISSFSVLACLLADNPMPVRPFLQLSPKRRFASDQRQNPMESSALTEDTLRVMKQSKGCSSIGLDLGIQLSTLIHVINVSYYTFEV
ncbi:hypothetical protein LY76DRAFT_182179 [Colletotrichum caudatum]|nr:hypothetical protein LY76DRAFT_182179 [Colletotrichum caudatum]